MIVGSGLIARAFAARADIARTGRCIYAAGVSNSACTDAREFARERVRLHETMRDAPASDLFVYFSTCSIGDPQASNTAYVVHKAAMEAAVTSARSQYLIFRLPQLAGFTPNPHTLLNYLFSRIVRSERFQVWSGARRNIIDVDDVATIAGDLINSEHALCETINIANTRSSSLSDIVSAMEAATQHVAIFDTVERGGDYPFDTSRISDSIARTGISFADSYLNRICHKYYGRHARSNT